MPWRFFLPGLWAMLAALPALATTLDLTSGNAVIALLRTDAARFEHGDGVERDGQKAASLYCEAARMGDAESQYDLGWMYANGRGVDRSDATAAFFFHAAAEQGHAQAQRMLATVGGPSTELPPCMRETVPPVPMPATAAGPAAARSGAALPWPPAVGRDAPPPILTLVKELAPQYQVDPELALSIIKVESNFNPIALSPKNAKGLMQLIPDTAARFGVVNAYDPAQNIRGGLSYLRWLLAYFEGDVRLVAAAYNAGERAVERYKGVPPYMETHLYVLKVLSTMTRWNVPFDASATAPSAEMARLRTLRRAAVK